VNHPLKCGGPTPLLQPPADHQPIRSPRSLPIYGTVILLAALLLASAKPASATIQYSVSLAHPEQHLFHVTMTIPDVHGSVTVQMPAWNALYQIRDFSDRVQQVQALLGHLRVPIEKVDKQTWRVQADGTVEIGYATYWDDSGPFATQLNAEHAFINPAMILLYVPDRRSEGVSVSFADVPSDWNAATAASAFDSKYGRVHNTVIQAAGFDALADAPIEIGKFQQFDLPGISPPVSVVVHGEGWNKKHLEESLSKICKYELRLMGGAPYQHYTFIFHIGRGYGGGGMEHANSTAIAIPSDEYLDGVAAHEFFHLWNVKRLRPASLVPVDYTKEQYTRALWFAEGVTSTYGSYTLLRSKLWTKQQFYDDLAQQISELESRPANRWQSAEQSSLDAWLEKYPLYNRPEYSVSYYTKGQVLGVLLDLQIRGSTLDSQSGVKSLDDVFRLMNDEFAKPNKPYNDSLDVRLAAEKVAGGSFEDFFQKYVASAEPLPYTETLAIAGLELRKTERRRPTLGFDAERAPEGNLVVRSVDADSNAAAAGLRAGDVIAQWNKQDPPRRIDRWLRGQKPGDVVHVTVRREEKRIEIDFHLGESTEVFYQVAEDAQAPEKAKRLREAWLRGD
jgi:predicted metalloprotease with PDZ domain